MVDLSTQDLDLSPVTNLLNTIQKRADAETKAELESVSALVDQMDKMQKAQLEQSKFQETQRHNRATESNQAATQRGNEQNRSLRTAELSEEVRQNDLDFMREQSPMDWTVFGQLLDHSIEQGDSSQIGQFLERMTQKYDDDFLAPWVVVSDAIRGGNLDAATLMTSAMLEGFEATDQLSGASKPTEAEQARAFMQQQFEERGLSSSDAALAANMRGFGLLDVEVGEDGIVREVDRLNNTFRVLVPPQQEGEPQSFRPTMSLWRAAERGTGPGSFFDVVYSDTVGLVWDSAVQQATISARTDLTTEQNQLVRALAVNPRYATTEMERIREEMAIRPEILDSPISMKVRMFAIDRSLERRAENLRKFIADPNTSAEDRNFDQKSLREIEAFQETLSVPKPEMFQTLDAVDAMTDEDIELMFMNTDRERLLEIPNNVLQEMNRRIR